MSWRDLIPKDRLDEFDDDTLPVVKDKLQAGLYSGKHKDHAEDYVAGVERDFEANVARRKERMTKENIPEIKSFHNEFGLTNKKLSLAKSDAIIMHPGPINRDIEISAEVSDGPKSVILQQVQNGVAIRMAIMDLLRTCPSKNS